MRASLVFLFQLNKTQSVVARRFDAALGGLGFTEFMILSYLHASPEKRMRRTDLAERVGLTPSGITRLLLPMEKIGLVKRAADERDARVSYVVLAPGGKQKLEDALERADLLCDELLPKRTKKQWEELTDVLENIG